MNFKKRVFGVLVPLFLVVVFIALTYCIYITYNEEEEVCYNETFSVDLNASRNVRNYISGAPLLLPDDFCAEGRPLVVVINGRLGNFDSRKAIRETWGRPHVNVSFYFLVGKEKVSKGEKQVLIEAESREWKDIIQEDFVDSYKNLTLKSINMLKLFHKHCLHSKYLLKVDDDVYLNVTNVLKTLQNRTGGGLLLGHWANDAPPVRDPCSKWYVPFTVYPEEKYPTYLCGPTYLMSSDVVGKLYECALDTPLVHIEDVFITGICAKKVQVKPQEDVAKIICLSLYNKYICKYRDFYALHNYSPEELRKSFKMLQEDKCWSQGSVLERIYSLFYG